MELDDIIIYTKYKVIDPEKLIADHFKFSYLNSYLEYLENIKKLYKNKITKEIYEEALRDYVIVRVNWVNNYLSHLIPLVVFSTEDKSLPKYYTPKKEYELPSKNYLVSLSDEELKDFLYTLPTKINDG